MSDSAYWEFRECVDNCPSISIDNGRWWKKCYKICDRERDRQYAIEMRERIARNTADQIMARIQLETIWTSGVPQNYEEETSAAWTVAWSTIAAGLAANVVRSALT